MANAQKGEVSFVIGERTFTLQMTTNALCELEDHLSTDEKRVTFQDVMLMVERMSATHVRALVWAAMQKHHPKTTIADVGALMDESGGLLSFIQKINALGVSATPDPADLKTLGVSRDGGPTVARRARKGRVAGTGARSSPRLAGQR